MEAVTSMEFAKRTRIDGSTTINHFVRVSLKLSLMEYTVLDFIYSHNEKQTIPITFSEFYKATGIIKEDIQEMFKSLKEKDLLVWDVKKKRVDVGAAWKSCFSHEEKFAVMWKVHPK